MGQFGGWRDAAGQIRGLNVPFWFILPIAGLPIVLTAVTRNPFWLPGIAVLTVLGRWLVGHDHNRPRVLYLALMRRGRCSPTGGIGRRQCGSWVETRHGGLWTGPRAAGTAERPVHQRFAPFIGHWTATVGVNQDGAAVVAWPRRGTRRICRRARQSRCASAPQRAGSRDRRSSDRGVGSPRPAGWAGRCPRCPTRITGTPRGLDAAYRDAQGDNLFCNGSVRHVRDAPHGGVPDVVAGGTSGIPGHRRYHDRGIRGHVAAGRNGSGAVYGARRLGVRERTVWRFRRSPRHST